MISIEDFIRLESLIVEQEKLIAELERRLSALENKDKNIV